MKEKAIKWKKLLSFLLALTLLGSSFSVFADNALQERKSFSDDFASYQYSSVDSARYTLYGEGSFASDSGRMQISYADPAPSGAGLFVNVADIAAPGEKVRLSFDYSNGNYSTAASAQVSVYADEKDGEILAATQAIQGKDGNTIASVSRQVITLPDYQSSAYIYIKGNAKKILIDNLEIERMEAGVYYPEGGSVEVMENTAYEQVAKKELFNDVCNYTDAASIPKDRYQLNISTHSFNNASGNIDVFSGSDATIPNGLGLRVSIKDILQNMKAKDSFYLTFNYRCNNGSTPSSIIAHLVVNGQECASQTLADNVCGENKQVDVFAKITLPDNLPEEVEEMYLLLEATKVNHAFYKNIVISERQLYTPQGGKAERLEESAYNDLAKTNLYVDSCSTYSEPSSIPSNLYWAYPETNENPGYGASTVNGFDKGSGYMQITYANNNNTTGFPHGLCMNIKDIIQAGNLGAGDSFYISYYYGCFNAATPSSSIMHFILNGAEVGSVVLAEGICSNNSKSGAYAYGKVTLPENLPANPEEMYLFLEADKIDKACYKDIILSIPKTAPANTLTAAEPMLNEAGNQAVVMVTNTTSKAVSLTVKRVNANGTAYADQTITAADGSVDAEYSFTASEGDTVTILAEGKTLLDKFILKNVHWVGTWAAAQQEITKAEDLPQIALSGSTLRQVVRISTGGDKFRLQLSNQYGGTPLSIASVHLAKTAAGELASSGIQTGTDTAVTFGGNPYVSVSPGESVVSDAISFAAGDLERVTITMKIISAPAKVTGHTGSRTTSYVAAGAEISAASMESAEKIERWYAISGLDVQKERDYGAVVCLGDSITDGRGVTTNKDNRWTDILAQRLKTGTGADENTKKLSVLNMGIGGNAVNKGGLGPIAVQRFKRDVLDQSGVKYLIILEGINDINSKSITAENREETLKNLLASYQSFISQAHAQGIKVYGGLITPFKGTSEYNENTEYIRTQVNQWITSNAGKDGGYDGYIDFASAVCAENDPLAMKESYQNDHLHPTAALYQKMGECISLDLFKHAAKEGEQQ